MCISPWLHLILDIVFFILGVIAVIVFTKWSCKKGWVDEKYCIALLASIVFGAYALVNYDFKKFKFDCEPPIKDNYQEEHPKN